MGYEVTIVKGIEISRNYAFCEGGSPNFDSFFFLGCDENPFWSYKSHEGWTQLFEDGTKENEFVSETFGF